MATSLSLAGKVALITGASSGIGAQTAVTFAKLGARLALTGRNVSALESLQKELTSQPTGRQINDVFIYAADMCSSSDREKLVEAAVKHFGRLDCLVNCAGILISGNIENPNIMQQFDTLFDVNTRAPLHLMHLAVQHLIATKGSIVNVSSVNGIRAFPGVLCYNASKAALDHITEGAALELAPKGVRVNSVNPGVTVTELHKRSGVDDVAYAKFLERAKETHPLGGPGNTQDVADAIAFLASDAARFITGAHLPVDGGRHATCLR